METYNKLLENANTSDILDQILFANNKEIFFPTINVADTRPYMTID